MATPSVQAGPIESKTLVSRHRGHSRHHGRRHGHRRHGRGVTRAHITNLGMLIPDKIVTKLTYSEGFNVAITTGIPQLFEFRGNSLFDPDVTFVGHQPYLFDELAALYATYQVHGCSIKIYPGPNATPPADPFSICCVPLNGQMSSALQPFVASELPYATFREFTGSGDDTPIISKFMSSRRMLGFTKDQSEADENERASVTQNPSTVWYWSTVVSSVDAVATAGCTLVFKLTYYCEFSRRKELGQSLEASIKPGHKYAPRPFRQVPTPTEPIEHKTPSPIVVSEPEYDIIKIPRSSKSNK